MKKFTFLIVLLFLLLSINSNAQENAFTFQFDGWINTIDLDNASQNPVGNVASNFGGMDFGPDNVLYGIDYNSNQLFSIDTSDATTTLIGTSLPETDHIWTGLAYDPATGIMYGIAAYGIVAGSSNLYTIDLTDGSVTLIGSQSTATALACIAIDDAGQMYGLQLAATPKIYIIDKTDGSVTLLGYNNKLWWRRNGLWNGFQF